MQVTYQHGIKVDWCYCPHGGHGCTELFYSPLEWTIVWEKQNNHFGAFSKWQIREAKQAGDQVIAAHGSMT